MSVTAILLAAGQGLRLKTGVSKPLVLLNKKPLIQYSLETLNSHPDISALIVVVHPDNKKKVCSLIKRLGIDKVKGVIEGGIRRQDSVFNGLSMLDPSADSVLIHDSARPFIENKCITETVREALKSGAAVTGVPVKSTIKQVLVSKRNPGVSIVVKTLPRENLWEIQTPQVFKKKIILEAFAAFGDSDVTDDAMMVEKLGYPVRIVRGSYNNIKITTPEDLIVGEAIAKKLNR
ncbi:MAG: 2-C-methyl-D-erythritol 4-phosphate cytidylyltransferase [Candidatus Omnitrophica bacterium]|nr:2-C-methyl-D-erythritol 4-phosphate cytidylyltransferase [Candidatus Omnitrophota bacterium]